MIQYKRRQLKKLGLMASPIVVAVLLLAVVFMAKATYRVYIQERDAWNELASIRARVVEMEEKSNNLEADIVKLSTDRGVEEEIREKFGVAKVGEGLVVIFDSVPDSTVTTNTTKEGLWQKFLGLFGK